MLYHYYSSEPSELLLAKPDTLAVITFGDTCAKLVEPGLIHTGVMSLDKTVVNEVWEFTGGAVERGISGNCYWSKTADIMCAAIWISPEKCRDITRATHEAYTDLLSYLQVSGYRYPCRFWNYIPRINLGEGEQEEYKKFCSGRLAAFSEQNIEAAFFPAASALGHQTDGAVIYVFASRSPGKQYENPSQERAYHYPRQYGTSSPSFSRATNAEIAKQTTLFISGTASIVGYESTSVSRLQGQLETTADNITLLLKHVGERVPPIQALKVYLRDPSDLEPARRFLASRYPNIPALFTQADICRNNLLVEIEAHCSQ